MDPRFEPRSLAPEPLHCLSNMITKTSLALDVYEFRSYPLKCLSRFVYLINVLQLSAICVGAGDTAENKTKILPSWDLHSDGRSQDNKQKK